ncbi:MAG: hypothetical protein U0263_30605 [Polyangiaceae bacterium]
MLRLRAPSFVVAGVVLGVWAMAGCKRTPAAPAGPPTKPTLGGAAGHQLGWGPGACGCVKDMLGGIDQRARLNTEEESGGAIPAGGGRAHAVQRSDAQGRRANPGGVESRGHRRVAEGHGLRGMDPGNNDWAGDAELARLAQKTGVLLVAANLGGKSGGAEPFRVVEAGVRKIGIVGTRAFSALSRRLA